MPAAKSKLEKVNAFPQQKKILSMVYEVFTWKNITSENENYLSQLLIQNPEIKDWRYQEQNDWRHLILDKIAHTYYVNNEIAKAFLVHNDIKKVKHISSLELLNALEVFYNKSDKSDYEKMLLSRKSKTKINFIDYINEQKGIYYLYHKEPDTALEFFNKNKSNEGGIMIPATIFSNNIKECFGCGVENVMVDEVYKADVFSFIDTLFSRKDLAMNLIELEKLTHDEKQWKVKLSHYLLANYYYNISNTGCYRGLLTNNDNCNIGYRFIDYVSDRYAQSKVGEDIIAGRSGYNLSNIAYYRKKYFDLCSASMQYYQNVIDLSTDKELNARCLYLMAKCELNAFYNIGSKDVLEVQLSKYRKLKLPNYKSFKILKEEYSDTKFHEMIIRECSYFRIYSSHY